MTQEVFIFPMSSAQQRLWFLQSLDPASTVFHIGHAVRLRGDLDVFALESALRTIQERHEILRTTFDLIDDQPSQLIGERVGAPLNHHDLRAHDDSAKEEALRQLAAEQLNRPFDLTRGPLLRMALLQLAEQEHVFLFTVHHIIFDGWSTGIFIDELCRCYRAFANGEAPRLPEPEIQYADFAVWQSETVKGERLLRQLSYWQGRLQDAPRFLELPADRVRPEQQSGQGGLVTFSLPDELSEALRWLARTRGVTPFMLLLSGFALLLQRSTGKRDLVIGTPVAGRIREELEPLIGFFVNTLPLRISLESGTSFSQLLHQVKQSCIDDLAHQELPFEKLVETLVPERDLRHSPLFQVTFALQNTPRSELQLDTLRIEPVPLALTTAKYDLSLLIQENDTSLTGGFEYNSDIFDRETVERLSRRFLLLLQQIADRPDAPLSELQVLTPAERTLLLDGWNNTFGEHDGEVPMARLFEIQADLRPRETAIICGEETVTYAELNRRANRLAHRLHAQGLQPGERVALCLPQGIPMIVALLGVLKAGGSYLPLDIDSPPARLALILEDARPAVLLCIAETRPLLPDSGHIPLIALDSPETGPTDICEDNPEVAGGGDQPAYILYTSGSTGIPKGVQIPQRAVNRLVRHSDFVTIAAGDRVGQAASPSFDAATFEIWGPLLNGGCLVIIPKEALLEPDCLARELKRQQIDILFLTTALFNHLADRCPDAFADLRCLLFGGEAVNPQRVRRVLELGPPQRLLHVYGPTETTTFACWHAVRAVEPQARTIPIGRPIANTSVYILDDEGEPVPIGVEGELHIGGPGLALGYLNQKELTRKRFIANPFGPGRLYKSGDLARFRSDGSIEFLGRADQQVKLRGFRIEPAEIETALRSLDRVVDCAVVLNHGRGQGGELAAFVVLDLPPDADHLWQQTLHRGLKEKLPPFMLPAAYLRLQALPLTGSSKVDRRMLAAMPLEPGEDSGPLPRSETEQTLADVWCEVLGLEQVGSRQNFFDLGGHSLLATRVISRIRDRLQVELPLKLLFEKPELPELARHIDLLRLATTAGQSGENEEFII